MMGVINITPNSFSDGGIFQDAQSVLNQIKKFKTNDVTYFDLGAESTAPFNGPITADLEWERLAPILESVVVSNLLDEQDYISIDTYKFDVFKKSFKLIKSLKPNQKIIWNDVSGKLEKEVLEFLSFNDFELIISHNLCSTRDNTSNHMNFVAETINVEDYFKNIKNKIFKLGLLDKVYFDPCFGFSKTLEQNNKLLSSIRDWLDIEMRWVLGVSRKSFLQAKCNGESKDKRILESETYHAQLITSWKSSFPDTPIVVRLHDPEVFKPDFLMK